MEVLNRSKNGNMFDRGFGTKATSTVQLFDEVTVNMSKNVNFVQFSPFDSSFDILAAGTLDSISVFRICFVNECNRQEMGANEQSPNQEELKFSFQFIHDYIIGSSSNSIAFSPKTNFMSMTPNGNQRHLLCFAIAADDDYGIRILSQQFRHDSNNLPIEDDKQTNHQFIIGHTDYINDMSFEPETGNLLASTSDDCTCCVWSIDDSDKNKLDMKILLSSPGMNVKWHPSEPNKLFVSEKKGIIRFYDIRTRMAVLSFECNRYPLMASDWCNENSFFIGCASAKSLFFWDTSLTSLPIKQIKTSFEGLSEFEFYDSKIVAYRGRPNNFLQIRNFVNNQVYVEKDFVAGRGLSWNRKMPFLAVGGPNAIHIFKIKYS